MDQRRVLFWKRLSLTQALTILVLRYLSYFMSVYAFAVSSVYGIRPITANVGQCMSLKTQSVIFSHARFFSDGILYPVFVCFMGIFF